MNILKFFLLCFLWILIFLLLVLPREAQAESAHLKLSHPQYSERGLSVDVELSGLFDDESLASLESGVPATLYFEWVVRQDRNGRKDPEVSRGQLHNRVVFDVLEEEFFLFNHQGRPLGACDALAGVESTLCNQESLRLGMVPELDPNHQYYIEMKVTLSVLSKKEVRGFENWLMGVESDARADQEMDVSEVGAESSGLNSSLSDLALGLVKKMAGIAEPSVKSRSSLFSGKTVED